MIIGIDPGKGGGVCALDGDKAEAWNCPDTYYEMARLVERIKRKNKTTVACIEKVHAMPRDGVASSFKFGANYGAWVGILSALNIGFTEVTPHKWQKHFGTMPKEKKSRKHRLKELAQQMFPSTKPTLKTADAILIAKYKNDVSNQGPKLK